MSIGIPMTRQEWTKNRYDSWANVLNSTRSDLIRSLEDGADAVSVNFGLGFKDFTAATAQTRVLRAALEAFEKDENPYTAMALAVRGCGDPKVGSTAIESLVAQWKLCQP